MFRKPIALLAVPVLLTAALSLGCGGGSAPSSPTKPSVGPVAKITLSPATASIAVGATQQLAASVTDASGNVITGASLTWSSSATSVATVSSSGLVTGVAAGSSNITAASGSVTSGAAAITVTPPPVASITVAPTSASIEVGATQQFTATAKDAGGNTISGTTFTWASSNASAASIDSTGLATGVAAGSSNITASAGGITSTAGALTVVQPTQVSGTAAMGAPLAGLTVTLRSAAGTGTGRTATTQSDGTFTLDSTGLTPPYVLSVTPNSGTPLYSASADANPTTTINLTPLADVTVRSWYTAQGLDIDAQFNGTAAPQAPSPAQLQPLLTFVQNQVQLWLNQQGVTGSFNLISTPFLANGSGVDKVLDETTVTNTSTASTIQVTDGTTTQTTALSYNTSNSSVTASTTTTNGTSTSTNTSTTAVPTTSAQSDALTAINAQLAALSQRMNQQGTALADTDIAPFFASDLMFEGLNQAQFAAEIATFARGNTANLVITQLNSLDVTQGSANAHVVFHLGTAQLTADMNFELNNGSWLLAGDGRVAGLDTESEYFVEQSGATVTNAQLDLFADIKSPPGLVSGATVSGGAFGNGVAFQQQSQLVQTFAPTPGGTLTVTQDHFNAGGAVSNTVAAGTPLSFDLATTAGSKSYTLYTNATTTEALQITGLSSAALSALNLGAANNFQWTLPKTFAVASIELKSDAYNGDPNNPATTDCRNTVQMSDVTATSGSVTIPSSCSGTIVRVEINVNVQGLNGETTTVVAVFQ